MVTKPKLGHNLLNITDLETDARWNITGIQD